MYKNEIFHKEHGISRFKKVSVLTHGYTPWEHYENAYVYITAEYVLIDALEAKTQILLPRESIKVIMTEGKFW